MLTNDDLESTFVLLSDATAATVRRIFHQRADRKRSTRRLGKLIAELEMGAIAAGDSATAPGFERDPGAPCIGLVNRPARMELAEDAAIVSLAASNGVIHPKPEGLGLDDHSPAGPCDRKREWGCSRVSRISSGGETKPGERVVKP